MRFKKQTLLYMFVIVALTLAIQCVFLSTLSWYFIPSKHMVHTVDKVSIRQPPLPGPKHYPRSLSNVQSDRDDSSIDLFQAGERIEIVRASEKSSDLAVEKIVRRKMSREGVEELEKAPKQSSKQSKDQGTVEEVAEKEVAEKQVRAEQSDKLPIKEFSGLRRATIRNKGIIQPTVGLEVTTSNTPDHTSSSFKNLEEHFNSNEIMERRWMDTHLKLVKSNSKLMGLLSHRGKPMEAYRKTLKIPRLKPGESVVDHVAHIHSLGKGSNLMAYLKAICNESGEPLLECMKRPMKKLSPYEEQGRNIMFTLRTTKKYHETRLETLFETWVTTLYPESLFLVTDDEDSELAEQLEEVGMHYINTRSGHTHSREDLCCKAGVELELMFQPQNEHFDWVCHVDDDMYVHVQPLAKQLSKFSPRTDPIYLGRSGSEWGSPRVVNTTSKLGKPGQRFHFAVGGMYCLSRAMVELAKPFLVGCHAFSDSCNKAQEPEDVTVGLITGVILKKPLTRTEMIFSHGLNLFTIVPPVFVREQIAFSHGYGSGEPWASLPNVVFIPGALFSIDEDITQFKSIHCYIYPTIHWCVDQKRILVEEKRKATIEGGNAECICGWETFMCCDVIKTSFFKTMALAAKYKKTPLDSKEQITHVQAPKEQHSVKTDQHKVRLNKHNVKVDQHYVKLNQYNVNLNQQKVETKQRKAIDPG